jgi:hypothetical protein
VKKGGLPVGKVEECYVENRCRSPRLCQLRTDGLASTSKY